MPAHLRFHRPRHSDKRIKMKVSTEEYISLIQERPALWQKSHPEFANRDVRGKLLSELAAATDSTAAECTKKLKNLKDTMRIQVAKLPKTSSGQPVFTSGEQYVTWPFFKSMLFMKDEFPWRKVALTSCVKCEEESDDDASETAEIELDLSQLNHQLEEQSGSDNQSVSVRSPARNSTDAVSKRNGHYSGGRASKRSTKKLKRRRPVADWSGSETTRKSTALLNTARTDELDTFAADIANDLRKIKCPLKLMQAKSKIRRIAEDLAISELLPATTESSPHEKTNNTGLAYTSQPVSSPHE
ncbi:transcription factor Adf-1 [Elysia marginata]|uniref:Transcription factor Adf-1 n=1 Tax=Elysia marginata TaxID=1093978 RepID=A0AAV4ED93_9GAST|nr:transcription factor Adf-1 [Elysia marginata]